MGIYQGFCVERTTGFEPATSTLANVMRFVRRDRSARRAGSTPLSSGDSSPKDDEVLAADWTRRGMAAGRVVRKAPFNRGQVSGFEWMIAGR